MLVVIFAEVIFHQLFLDFLNHYPHIWGYVCVTIGYLAYLNPASDEEIISKEDAWRLLRLQTQV